MGCRPRLVASAAVVSLLLLFGNDRVWSQSDGPVFEQDPGLEDLEPLAPQGRARGQANRGMYKSRISPHWFSENSKFWYRNDLPRGTREFVFVDTREGTRVAAFDHNRLAAALSSAAGEIYSADRLPFTAIRFDSEMETVEFVVEEQGWRCDLESYACAKADLKVEDFAEPAGGQQRGRFGRRSRGRQGRGADAVVASPDGKWAATVREQNVHFRSGEEGPWIPLSEDGVEGNSYANPQWSPDSKTIVAFRVEPGDNSLVHLIESSPEDGQRANLTSRPYALPGDKFRSYELNLFDVEERRHHKPDVDRVDFGIPRLRWNPENNHFTYEKVDRGHQRYRLIDIDSTTGTARDLIDEKSETFIWTAHVENVSLARLNWLERTDEIIYHSERDGWRHLYLVDSESGGIKNQITKGEFVVRGIDWIDEDSRQVWFSASGMNADQDPYLIHHYRIDFDGSGLVPLTDGNGNHSVQFSPDRQFLIDTYSRVDAAPVHELRRCADGKLVCQLEQADVSELAERGFRPPIVFTAKGRDGETDIWGVLTPPSDFDPSRKYPIIEAIYAGPHDSHVPKTFSPRNRYSALADKGYVVVQIDGMGTANRSKAFHDVCWKNLKDAGFPDRILWIQAAAEKYPYMDVNRVGIYGTSAGGQNAAGAVLFHPEFYKAASANCGCHDNRMDKASWNEQWMGYPVGPHYAESSNIDNAYRLQGYLMLIHGELDTNVPPESTLRLVDALVKADKDFELIFVPGGGHGAGQASAYHRRRMYEFFARHLQGATIPNHNANGESPEAGSRRPPERSAQVQTTATSSSGLAPR